VLFVTGAPDSHNREKHPSFAKSSNARSLSKKRVLWNIAIECDGARRYSIRALRNLLYEKSYSPSSTRRSRRAGGASGFQASSTGTLAIHPPRPVLPKDLRGYSHVVHKLSTRWVSVHEIVAPPADLRFNRFGDGCTGGGKKIALSDDSGRCWSPVG